MELLERLIDYSNIHLAYERTKNDLMNRELHCFHEQEIFEKCIPQIYDDICNVLKKPKEYCFENIEILHKPKEYLEENSWDTRPLARINFYDSVVIQAVINIISELVASLLAKQNYGYQLRDKSSVHMYEFWKTGYSRCTASEIEASSKKSLYKYVVECDIHKFYPTISHTKLKEELRPYIISSKDQYPYILIDWVNRILEIKQVGNIDKYTEGIGLPQGPLYSPLFALFYIRNCFKYLEPCLTNVYYFGYVDDFRFYCETEEQAHLVKENFLEFLKERELTENRNKTVVLSVNKTKSVESKIMGKASNIGRAICNDVILSSTGKREIKDNLLELIKETDELYQKLQDEYNDISKFRMRINKFGLYRIIKLTESTAEWSKYIELLKDPKQLSSNYIATLHVLFVLAETVRDKQKLMDILLDIILDDTYKQLSYIKFIALQYYFMRSPIDAKLPNDIIIESIDKIFNNIREDIVYLKAILSRCHKDWFSFINNYFLGMIHTDADREFRVMINNIFYKQDISNKCIYDPPYNVVTVTHKFMQREKSLEYIFKANNYAKDMYERYLDDETFKNVQYVKLKRNMLVKNKSSQVWDIELDNNFISFNEYWNNLDSTSIRTLFLRIFEWLNVQLNYSTLTQRLIPSSIVDPEHIWFEKDVDIDKGVILLVGNPFFQNEVFYRRVPESLWKKTFIKLFECGFDIEFSTLNKGFLSESIQFWQFRIIQLLKARGFDTKKFIVSTIQILRDISFNSCTYVTAEHFQLSHLIRHYIPCAELHDKFTEITRFVESSWTNGSKECFFFTLHNQEHARFLIYKIHELIERSGFRIYLNQKEAFRLFSSCFLHDIGMLSNPLEKEMYLKEPDSLNNIFEELIPAFSYEETVKKIEKNAVNKKRLFDIYKILEEFRSGIVRDNHHLVSMNDIMWDYPLLPLSVAERRDIGTICRSHNSNRDEVDSLQEDLFDGRSPINIKLLSCLLRIIDLCDVSRSRVSKEVLERNQEIMGDESIFHWVKHMSVDSIEILKLKRKKTTIQFKIVHNYLPNLYVPKEKLCGACKSKCKKRHKLKIMDGEVNMLDFKLNEEGSIIKYLDKEECSIQCAFINKAYYWFYPEVIYLNELFKQKGIDIKLDLSITYNKNFRDDFLFVENRNEQKSAQDFFINYLLG